jgi:hypothetical protein
MSRSDRCRIALRAQVSRASGYHWSLSRLTMGAVVPRISNNTHAAKQDTFPTVHSVANQASTTGFDGPAWRSLEQRQGNRLPDNKGGYESQDWPSADSTLETSRQLQAHRALPSFHCSPGCPRRHNQFSLAIQLGPGLG